MVGKLLTPLQYYLQHLESTGFRALRTSSKPIPKSNPMYIRRGQNRPNMISLFLRVLSVDLTCNTPCQLPIIQDAAFYKVQDPGSTSEYLFVFRIHDNTWISRTLTWNNIYCYFKAIEIFREVTTSLFWTLIFLNHWTFFSLGLYECRFCNPFRWSWVRKSVSDCNEKIQRWSWFSKGSKSQSVRKLDRKVRVPALWSYR